MKKIIIFSLCFFMLATVFMASKYSFAQEYEEGSLGADIKKTQKEVGNAYSPDEVGFGEGQKNVLSLYRLILGRFTALISLFFFIYTIVGGYQWMMAGGNEEKVSEAKGKIINGAIGVGIVLAAYVITYFVFSQISSVTGVKTGF